MQIWRTTDIESLLQSAKEALATVESQEISYDEFGVQSVDIMSELVDSLQGILSHECQEGSQG